jgi:hypothetical protein
VFKQICFAEGKARFGWIETGVGQRTGEFRQVGPSAKADAPARGEIGSGAPLDPEGTPAATTSRGTAQSSPSLSIIGHCQRFTRARPLELCSITPVHSLSGRRPQSSWNITPSILSQRLSSKLPLDLRFRLWRAGPKRPELALIRVQYSASRPVRLELDAIARYLEIPCVIRRLGVQQQYIQMVRPPRGGWLHRSQRLRLAVCQPVPYGFLAPCKPL